MNARINLMALVLAAALLLAACAGPSTTPANGLSDLAQAAPMQAARALEQRAAQAFGRGEHRAALADYRQAATLYASLAALDAQLRAQLNAARVLADSGDTAAGVATLDEVLARMAQADALGASPVMTAAATNAPATSVSADTRLLAYGRAAALRLTSDASAAQLQAAELHLARASTLCGLVVANATNLTNATNATNATNVLATPPCPQAAALYVLQARAALLRRDPTRAQALASAALRMQPSAAEQANALRLRAYAALATFSAVATPALSVPGAPRAASISSGTTFGPERGAARSPVAASGLASTLSAAKASSPSLPSPSSLAPSPLEQAWADAQTALRLDQTLGFAPRVADDLRALLALARARQLPDWDAHYQSLLDQTGAQSAASRRSLPFAPPHHGQPTFGPAAVTPF